MPSLKLPLASILILLFVSLSKAQVQNVANEVATPIPGVGHDYIRSLSETVNPANGGLSIRIDSNSVWGLTIQNPVGRLVLAQTSGSALAGAVSSYDAVGRVVDQWQCTAINCGQGSWHLNYQYDLAGNTVTFGTGVAPVYTQTFDTAGRVTGLSSSYVDSQHPATLATADASVGYYPTGAVRKMTFGNSLTQTAAYNNRLQPCRMNVNSSGGYYSSCADAIPPGNFQDFNYGLNLGSSDNGNVANWTATGQQAFTRSSTYDSVNRLASLNQSSGAATGCSTTFSLSWNYDAWGNRTDQNVTGGTCNALHTSVNTLNQFVGSPYQYDAAGNMINDGNHQYFYDAENRLAQVGGTFGNCATAAACYVYDANGRRVQRLYPGSNPMNFLYNLAGNVVSEVGIAPGTWNPSNPSIGWHAGYIYLDQVKLLGEYTNRTTYFAHPDHLGSTRLLTSTGPATRIQSSGGTSTTKYYYSGACPSVSGATYTIMVWIKNQGTTSVKVSGNIADGPTIAPGTAQQVTFNETGNGSSCAQLDFASMNTGDSFDILAYYPLIIPNGGSNLIPSGNQNFTGWSTYQGSSVTVTQQQAAFVYDSMDYLPFGEQIAGGSITPHKFTGKERDSESGLDNFGARYDSSSIGRFMSPDSGVDQHPEAPQSWNLYTYALNNPLNLVDPTGEYVCANSITQQQCDNFQKSLDAAQADANKLKDTYGANSTEYKDAQRAIDFYGKEGVDNGVTLTLGGLPKGSEGHVDPNVGTTTPTADNPLGQKITVHFAESAFSGSEDNAILLGHEGSHGADASDWVKSGFSPGMNPNLYHSEYRAFQVSVSLAVISGYGPLGFFVGQDQKKVYIWQPAWTRQAGWGKES